MGHLVSRFFSSVRGQPEHGRTSPQVCEQTILPARQNKTVRNCTHRVGRTGRMGSSGRAWTLVSGAEIGELRSMETCTQVKNCSPAVGRRYANAATGNPEHPSSAHAVTHGRRSILVNSTEPRNAYNQRVSHVRDGSIFPSRMAGRRHNSRLPRRYPDRLAEGGSSGSQHAAALLGDVSQYETRDSQSLNRKPDVSQIAHPPKETDET